MNKTCGIAHRHTHCLWSCYRFVLSCAQQNNGPQRCLHPNPWSLGPCQVTRQRGAKVADGTKLLIDLGKSLSIKQFKIPQSWKLGVQEHRGGTISHPWTQARKEMMGE